MAQRETDRLIIDGSSLADLDLTEAKPVQDGLWAFLTQVVPRHPWIAGLAAIVGIVAFGGDHNPWVLETAIIGVTVITVASTRKRSSYE